MPSPFDFTDPSVIAATGGGGNGLDNISSILDTPDMRRQRLFDTMGGIGAAMLQASGPSRTPMNLGSILGYGLAGGLQAGNEDKYLKRALTGAQIAKARHDMALDKSFSDLLSGGGGAAAATPAPVGNGPATAAMPAMEPSGPYQAVTSTAESGNDPKIVNPTSGASGLFQFLPSTAADVRKNNPDLNLPEDFRTWTEPQQRAAETRFRETNGKVLQAAGVPTTPANLYIAHRAGAQGAQTILNAPPDTQLSTTLPPDWLAQNPDMRTTAGAFVQSAQNRFAGVPGAGVAQGDSVPAGGLKADASGNAIQPAQYKPPAEAQTIQQVIQKIPPGVRQMIGAMGRKEGIAQILKYAEPGSQAALHIPSGQIVFAPKDQIGKDPNLAPTEGAELEVKRGTLANRQEQTAIQNRNARVIMGPNGQPMVNEPLVSADERVSRAQGAGAIEPHADKVMIDQATKEHGELQANALKARTGLAQVQRLSNLLDQVNTNRFTSTTQEIKAMAKGVGIDLEALGIKDNTGPADAAKALSNQFALSLRDPSSGGGMPGALSDSDRKFLAQMVPNLDTTPEGRKLMVDFMSRMYQRQIDLAKVANDYVRGGGVKKDPAGLYATLQQYADSNPIFDPAKDAPTGGMSPMPGGAAPAPAGGADLFKRYGLTPK